MVLFFFFFFSFPLLLYLLLILFYLPSLFRSVNCQLLFQSMLLTTISWWTVLDIFLYSKPNPKSCLSVILPLFTPHIIPTTSVRRGTSVHRLHLSTDHFGASGTSVLLSTAIWQPTLTDAILLTSVSADNVRTPFLSASPSLWISVF